jgi:hypothetical protein
MSSSPVVGIVDVLYVNACSGIGPPTTTAKARRQRHTSARHHLRQRPYVQLHGYQRGVCPRFWQHVAGEVIRADWVGSVTVRASGDTSDLSPYVLEGSLVWELAPGQYEAHGSGSQTVGNGALSMSGKAGLSKFPASSFSRALTGGARACTTYRTATATPSRSIFLGARCSQKRSTSGAGNAGSPHEEVVSQKRFRVHKPSSLGGLDSADGFSGEVDVSKAGAGFKRPPSPRRRSSYRPEPSPLVTGAKRGSGVFDLEEPKAEAGSQPSLVGVYKSSIARSVLGGKMKSYNPLLQVFQKFEELGEELKVVDYVPQPFDGDQIFIRPKGSGLTDRLVDAQHWGKGTNIHPALLGKEQVRLWKCEGGMFVTMKNVGTQNLRGSRMMWLLTKRRMGGGTSNGARLKHDQSEIVKQRGTQ